MRNISHEAHGGKSDKTSGIKRINLKETVSSCVFLWSMMAWLPFMGLESYKENCNHAVACLVAGRLMCLLTVLF